MNTDKEVYQIIRSCPEMIFGLAKIDFPGPGKMESVTVKALQRTMDALFRPDDLDAPLFVIEVQFQKSPNIYQRIVAEMAQIQEENGSASIEGIILFATAKLDPKTLPWTKVVRSVFLDEMLTELEEEDVSHPLVAVFKPVFEANKTELEKHAAKYYRQIEASPLEPIQRDALLDVFLSWLIERLGKITIKDLSMILELPDIKDTVCGRELIEEGKEKALSQAAIRFAEGRFGKLAPEVSSMIESLSAKDSDSLIGELAAASLKNIDDLQHWLKAK